MLSRVKKTFLLSVMLVLFVPLSIGVFDANVYAKAGQKGNAIVLKVGEKVNLKVSGSSKNVRWKTSNKKVAKVSKKGKVVALNEGKATITTKVEKKIFKCKVTVKPNEEKSEKKIDNSSKSTNSNVVITDDMNQVVTLINEIRTKEGLKPLQMDNQLCEAAYVRATECDELFSHTRLDGTSCFTAFDQAGIDDWTRRAENLAEDYDTPAEVVNAWMKSPTHKANIMNGEFEYIGIGCVKVGEHIYWTQEFLTR